MKPLANDTFLRALRREPTDHTPVWLMRQAGRYLPEYNATRKRAGSFLNLCKSPEMACEVTLQPLERYPLDAAILFSDILTVPDAMGLGLYFAEGEGPKFERTVRDEAAVARLAVPDPGAELRYVTDAVRTIRRALDGRVPLIGFSGSPWTLACYMVEGGGSSDFRQIKTLLYKRPDLLERILAVNAQAVAAYLNAQIEAGAQAVMIFDSWGGALADGAFQRFSLAWTRKVVEQLVRERDEPVLGADGRAAGSRKVPVPAIVFTKGGGLWLEQIADIGCDAVGVDWTVNLGQARARVGTRCAIQGNLDPMALMAEPEQVRAEARAVLDAFGTPGAGTGHVFNLGHGISQFTPPDNVSVLVDEVHRYSREQRRGGALTPAV
ncbi:uroporphyrinogen decarboxylase [Zeimonas arvi]|uniref:Uroporphyrinogen decarboxylase n=1 Tax=Zeimonas arvi TaxID=2498847 RepID=A0A5C8NUF6_9BURK|nr:uroporphyrinogen decarboxylase [Zeimonas arvi]TXL64817.1 uroporphyrinogen decarboxylase [Zeimonas arvi]